MEMKDYAFKILLKYLKPQLIINLHSRGELTLTKEQLESVIKKRDEK